MAMYGWELEPPSADDQFAIIGAVMGLLGTVMMTVDRKMPPTIELDADVDLNIDDDFISEDSLEFKRRDAGLAPSSIKLARISPQRAPKLSPPRGAEVALL